MQGVIEDAEQQIEFINEMQVSTGRTADIAYLEGQLTLRKQFKNDQERLQTGMKFIDEALKMHINVTKNLLPGFDFYTHLNADFLLSLAQTYLSNVGMKEMMEGK
jgi:tetratricopeptide repeat protein 21B